MNMGKFAINEGEEDKRCVMTWLVGLFFLILISAASLRAIATLD
jgi:hypothetical protein